MDGLKYVVFELHNFPLLKVDGFEGFSNQSKTDGMVNNHLSSCNSHQFSLNCNNM